MDIGNEMSKDRGLLVPRPLHALAVKAADRPYMLLPVLGANTKHQSEFFGFLCRKEHLENRQEDDRCISNIYAISVFPPMESGKARH